MGAPSHKSLLSPWNVVNATKEMNFKCLIWINLKVSVNNYMWVTATRLDSVTLECVSWLWDGSQSGDLLVGEVGVYMC